MLTRQYIDDHQVVERYLADQLSDVERDEFEDYYAEHPDVLRELDAAAGIKLGVAMLRESGELATLTKVPPARRWHTGWGLAATLLVAIIVGTYWAKNETQPPAILSGNLDALGRPSIAASYQIQRTRSDVDAIVSLPPRPQAIELRIRPVFAPPAASYQIELLSIAEGSEIRTPVAAIDELGPGADGLVTIYVSSARLRPGSYELRVADAANSSAINDFLVVITGENAPTR
jgi:hypothetical protein